MEDYDISQFFNTITNELVDIECLVDLQKQQLIRALFDFLKHQDPELDENFSFIHFIEVIDKLDYKIYDAELIKLNTKNGTITFTLLLNRF
ncbi:hypothetical protein [Winogradskyella sp. PC D3.3]